MSKIVNIVCLVASIPFLVYIYNFARVVIAVTL